MVILVADVKFKNGIQITHEGDHYVVYVDGVFFCTADTHEEAVRELEREGVIA